jgi:ElaB/YqjD/DUF883 family membrane-anchored ribosome-binding protein
MAIFHKSPADEMRAIRNDIDSLRSDVGSLLSALGDSGTSRYNAMRDRVGGAVHHGAESVRDAAESAGHAVGDGVRRARECTLDHPYAAVLVTAGAALLAGALLWRRR